MLSRYLDISVPRGYKIAVIGDIHEHEEQFDKALEFFNNLDDSILISVGDIYEKGFGRSCAESIIDKLKPLIEEKRAYFILGNHELKMLRLSKIDGYDDDYLAWCTKQPLSLSFNFRSGKRLTVLHGGVTPKHTWEDLRANTEICYIRMVDKKGKYIKLKKKIIDGKKIMVPEKPGQVWHEVYDGRFGYIVSGHDSQKDGVPKFYRYSCNLDTACYHTGKLTMQIFGDSGKEDLIIFEGEPKYPDLDEMLRLMAEGLI